MPENLDKVDWKALNCPEMPQWVRGINSSYNKEREISYKKIYDCAVDTPNRISVYLVPILIELLLNKDTPDKKSIILLLAHLAGNTWSVHQKSSHTLLHSEIQQAIAKGKELYLEYLKQQYDGYIQVLYIIRYIPKFTSDVIPDLIDLINQYTNDTFRKTCFETLGYLIETVPDLETKNRYISYLRQSFDTEKDKNIVYTIALLLLKFQGQQIPINVFIALKAYFRDNLILPHIHDILRLNGDDAIEIILDSLSYQVAQDSASIKMIAFLLALIFDDGDINFSILMVMMQWHYEEKSILFEKVRNKEPIIPVTKLDDRQKQVLGKIVQYKELWDIKTNLYALYGLPDTLEGIEKLVLL